MIQITVVHCTNVHNVINHMILHYIMSLKIFLRKITNSHRVQITKMCQVITPEISIIILKVLLLENNSVNQTSFVSEEFAQKFSFGQYEIN